MGLMNRDKQSGLRSQKP